MKKRYKIDGMKMLNIECSNHCDATKVILLAKELNVLDKLMYTTKSAVEDHKVKSDLSSNKLSSIVIVDELMFGYRIIPTSELENCIQNYDYAVNAYDILKHFSH